MRFEWDNAKAASNHLKHGVTFEFAVGVFYDEEYFDVEDDRKDYGELRLAAFGRIKNRVYVVTYTRREEVIRIISARKANGREQKKYYAVCV